MSNPFQGMREREAAMAAAWPTWEVAYRILHRPPWPVMEWLRSFRAALLAGTEAFEQHIAGGGLDIEIVGACSCDIVEPGKETELLRQAERAMDFATLERIYSQLAWGGARERVAEIINTRTPHDMRELALDDALAWLHANHPGYNRAKRHLVTTTIGLQALRGILERDLATTDPKLGKEWGTILRKDYARDLIENFVDGTSWCDEPKTLSR